MFGTLFSFLRRRKQPARPVRQARRQSFLAPPIGVEAEGVTDIAETIPEAVVGIAGFVDSSDETEVRRKPIIEAPAYTPSTDVPLERESSSSSHSHHSHDYSSDCGSSSDSGSSDCGSSSSD